MPDRSEEFLAVYQCPDHDDFVTLTVEDKGGSGQRIAGGKCCVRQYAKLIRRWPMERIKHEALVDALTEAHDV